jgi:MFS family permease
MSAPVGTGFLLITPLLDTIGEALGSTANVGWIASGWSTSSAVSFSLAGAFSDIFGRKHVIIIGQIFTVIGAVSICSAPVRFCTSLNSPREQIVACTANATTTVIAGSTILGFGAGFVFVTYAAIPEILPNKYR